VIRVFLGLLMFVGLGGFVGGGVILYRDIVERREAAQAEIPVFVDLEVLYVPIKASNGAVESWGYALTIETRQGQALTELRKATPWLRDFFRTELVQLTERRDVSQPSRQGIENIEQVKSHLTEAANYEINRRFGTTIKIVQNISLRGIRPSLGG
jgi:hypothetical protein